MSAPKAQAKSNDKVKEPHPGVVTDMPESLKGMSADELKAAVDLTRTLVEGVTMPEDRTVCFTLDAIQAFEELRAFFGRRRVVQPPRSIVSE